MGGHVYVQNLTGNHPKRWERTGVVVEVRQFHQYVVKIDGSGRLTIHNRQHLRQFTPFQSRTQEEVIQNLMPLAKSPVVEDILPERKDTEDPPSDGALPTGSQPNHPLDVDSAAPPSQTQPMIDTIPPPSASPFPPAPPKKLPRALACLLPYNEPGAKETAPTRQTRSRRAKN